jgi:hypothetical protein
MKNDAEEMKNFTQLNQNDTTTVTIPVEDNLFEQIDLKIEKEDIINREVFFNTQVKRKTRRIGNTWAFMFDKNGDPRIVIGPHCKSILI